MSRFSGESAVVTGVASGIGRAIALGIIREGGTVYGVDRNLLGLEAIAREHPAAFHPFPCDLSEREPWLALLKRLPAVRLLVNAAAISRQSQLEGDDDPEWQSIIDTNLNAARLACFQFAQRMPLGGRIVNITSVHGRLIERGSFAYSVGKAALEQVTRALAVELAPRGILVNALAPGFVDTPMSRATGINELETEWFRSQYLENGRIPLRRAAQPEEIAPAALFLLSRDNSYITGQIIAIDGGLTLTL